MGAHPSVDLFDQSGLIDDAGYDAQVVNILHFYTWSIRCFVHAPQNTSPAKRTCGMWVEGLPVVDRRVGGQVLVEHNVADVVLLQQSLAVLVGWMVHNPEYVPKRLWSGGGQVSRMRNPFRRERLQRRVVTHGEHHAAWDMTAMRADHDVAAFVVLSQPVTRGGDLGRHHEERARSSSLLEALQCAEAYQ